MSKPTEERLQAQLEKPNLTPGNVGHAGSGTQPEDGPHGHEEGDDHIHHVPMSMYYKVFTFLMIMLFITVAAWWVDQGPLPLGRLSVWVALAIAVAKAAAIVMIFMHVKFSSRLVQVFACTGLAFTAILFLLTFNDYATRHWIPDADEQPSITRVADTNAPPPSH